MCFSETASYKLSDVRPLSYMQRLTACSGAAHKSKATIPKSLDKAMDAASKPVKHAAPGISIRNGPVEDMDVDGKPEANGKRKARASISNGVSYKDASDDEDDEEPLVGRHGLPWP